MMDVNKVVEYWLITAKDDLIAVEHLVESGDYVHALFLVTCIWKNYSKQR